MNGLQKPKVSFSSIFLHSQTSFSYFVFAFLSGLLEVGFRIGRFYLLNSFIATLPSRPSATSLIILFAVSFSACIFVWLTSLLSLLLGIRIRSFVSRQIFNAAFQTNATVSPIPLLTGDVYKLEVFASCFVYLLLRPVEIVCWVLMVGREHGSLLALLSSFPAVIFIVKVIAMRSLTYDLRFKMNIWRDELVRKFDSFLNGIYIVKAHAWEQYFVRELARVREGYAILLWRALVWNCIPMLNTLLFSSQVILLSLCVKGIVDGELRVKGLIGWIVAIVQISTCLSGKFVKGLEGFGDAKIAAKRISEFLKGEKGEDEKLNVDTKVTDDFCAKVFGKFVVFQKRENCHFLTEFLHYYCVDNELNSNCQTNECSIEKVNEICSDTFKSRDKKCNNLSDSVNHNEMNLSICNHFSIRNHFSSAAVCLQSEWILNSSIKENISLGIINDESEERLRNCLIACCLWDEVHSLPDVLNYQVGQNGVKLSGGQRHRLAIARVLYHSEKFNLFVFDNFLHGINETVSLQIIHNVTDWLRGKSVIFVSEHLNVIEKCQLIVRIEDDLPVITENGRFIPCSNQSHIINCNFVPVDDLSVESEYGDIHDVGKTQDIEKTQEVVFKVSFDNQSQENTGDNHHFCNPVESNNFVFDKLADISNEETTEILKVAQTNDIKKIDSTSQLYNSTSQLYNSTSQLYNSTSQLYNSTSQLHNSTSKMHNSTFQLHNSNSQLHKSNSQLQKSNYKVTTFSIDVKIIVLLCILTIIPEICKIIQIKLFNGWSSRSMPLYSSLFFITFFFTLVRCYFITWISFRYCQSLFLKVTETIFYSIPYHTLINSNILSSALLTRIAKDQIAIDEGLAEILSEFLQCIFSIASRITQLLLINSVSFRIFSLVLILATASFWLLIRYIFIRKSTRIKEAENSSREFLISFLKSTVANPSHILTINCFHFKSQLLSKATGLLDDCQKESVRFALFSCSFTLIVDLFCVIYVGLVFIVRISKLSDIFVVVKMSGEMSGFLQWLLSCSIGWEEYRNVINRMGLLFNVAKQENGADGWRNTNEESSNSLDLVPNTADDNQSSVPISDFPCQSTSSSDIPILKITDLTFSLLSSSSLPPLIKNFSLSLFPSSRTALKGRTGCGKSTLFSILLRLTPSKTIRSGSVQIFNTPYSTLPLPPTPAFYSLFSVVPQTSVIFQDMTFRFNLDPTCSIADHTLWSVIISCNLHYHSLNLDSPIPSYLYTHSHSHSLFCYRIGIARAVLRHSARVFLFDEAIDSFSGSEQKQLLDTIWKVTGEGKALLMITHNEQCLYEFDSVIEMS